MSPSSSVDQHALLLAMGISGVLLLASLVGLGLKRVVARGEPHAVIDNLNDRVRAWWIIAAIVGLALLGGTPGVTLLFAAASSVALRELTNHAALGRGADMLRYAALYAVLPLQYLFAGLGWHALHALFIPGCVLLAASIGAIMGDRRCDYVTNAATTHMGLLLCVYAISHVPALLALEIPGYAGRNAFLVLFLILVVQASDVLQYIFGKLCGRRQIAPAISPAKTVEGFVGGVLSAVALGATLAWITPFTTVEAALISAALTLLGFLGGLVFSAIKRRLGIKDWGSLIPGHGGMLDRLDSLCLSAPVFYYLVRSGWSA